MGGLPISSSDMEKHYREMDYYGASSYYTRGVTIDVSSSKRVTNASQVFTKTNMIDEFNPAKIKLPREACDSAKSPHSRGIIYAEDVTGSMGKYLLELIQEHFPRLIEMTYDTVSFNPHIMFMGVGDVTAGDEAPLQVTQFETDIRMIEQLTQIWLEKRGGVNSYESYILPWYFAGKYCKMDCFDKRGEKGFLFTFGDEEPTPELTPYELMRVFGNRDDLDRRKVTATDCLEMASEKFNCYHIILRGDNYEYIDISKWKELMGGHACDLSDYQCMPDLVCTILKMYEGISKTEAILSIEDSHTRRVVEEALAYHEEYVEDQKVKSNNQEEIELF